MKQKTQNVLFQSPGGRQNISFVIHVISWQIKGISEEEKNLGSFCL